MDFGGLKLPTVDLTNPESVTGLILLLTTLASSVTTAIASTTKKLKDNAVKLIGRAEEKFTDEDDTGVDKHKYVVDKLYLLVPLVFRPFFSKELLSRFVNSTFEHVNHFSELRSANLVESGGKEENEIDNQKLPKASINEERRNGANTTKINNANQQMPCDGVLQDRGVQSAVQVFTLRGRYGVVFRAEYRVCKRNWNRARNRPG